jgi:hypothetical protein
MGIETWGSGGQMLDIVTLVDGKVLLISATAIVLYANRLAFDKWSRRQSGRPGSSMIRRPTFLHCDRLALF